MQTALKLAKRAPGRPKVRAGAEPGQDQRRTVRVSAADWTALKWITPARWRVVGLIAAAAWREAIASRVADHPVTIILPPWGAASGKKVKPWVNELGAPLTPGARRKPGPKPRTMYGVPLRTTEAEAAAAQAAADTARAHMASLDYSAMAAGLPRYGDMLAAVQALHTSVHALQRDGVVPLNVGGVEEARACLARAGVALPELAPPRRVDIRRQAWVQLSRYEVRSLVAAARTGHVNVSAGILLGRLERSLREAPGKAPEEITQGAGNGAEAP